MNGLLNYNTYLSGMAQGNEEKLFFLQQIDLQTFDRIIDFGCGRGDILKACGFVNKHAELIGIDSDDYMRRLAEDNLILLGGNIRVVEALTRDMLDEKTLIIFSGVLHEVEEYWFTLRELLKGTGCTIAIRDMRYSQPYSQAVAPNDLAALVAHSNPELLATFIRKYGMDTEKELVHYLLKYTYVDNWALELAEDYFSFAFDDLFSLGEIFYERNYILPYKLHSVAQDFNIRLPTPTHTQIILKVKKD